MEEVSISDGDNAIGTEARALYNLGQAEGLTIWSPNVNIYRDPRWGRGQETPGEDPTTASKYAVAFVKGLQGSTPGTLQTSACCKHATAYDLEEWNGVARYNFNAKVTAQDLADTFNPPFKSCVVDAKASCVMCAYTDINVALLRDAQRYAPTPEDTVAVAIKAGLDLNCGNYTQVHGMAALQQGKMRESDVDRALTNLFAFIYAMKDDDFIYVG
uniref:Glycoside hydrolase family 3 N-terminal domain-containing protein n=1 Tax=Oryza barthii TaxID=65489 RepID=A0A0D3HKP2_9ORYZ